MRTASKADSTYQDRHIRLQLVTWQIEIRKTPTLETQQQIAKKKLHVCIMDRSQKLKY